MRFAIISTTTLSCLSLANAQHSIRGLASYSFMIPAEKDVGGKNAPPEKNVDGTDTDTTTPMDAEKDAKQMGTTATTTTTTVDDTDTEIVMEATCSSHSACAELSGDCCPTADGVYLDCCFQACSAHSQCSHLDGNCCPTHDGTMLDCCDFDTVMGGLFDDIDTRQPPLNATGRVGGEEPTEKQVSSGTCGIYPQCEALGLEGECCPTIDGVYLDCCQATCKSNPQCEALGLEGECCPTADGVYLDCCDAPPTAPTGRTAGSGTYEADPSDPSERQGEDTMGSCAVYPECDALGLEGECCPTVDGVFLDCCQSTCNSNPQCEALGLEGECCPTNDGVYLDCCENAPSNPGFLRNAGSETETEAEAEDLGSACEKNPVCVLEGVEGECCPTPDGVYLSCCNRECSLHSECESNSLVETCCPTPDGVELDCCDHQAKMEAVREERAAYSLCSAHEECAGLDGNCCPTNDGVFLACCKED